MNILTLSNYYPEHRGGIEFVASNLVSRWRKNHTVRWMACEPASHPHVAEPGDIPLRALNLTETRLGFPYPLPFPASLPRILEQVRWCDVVHLHDCLYAPNQIAFWAARHYRKPVLVTQHVAPVPYPQAYKNILQHLAYLSLGKMLLENAEQVIFISQRVQEWFTQRMHFRHLPRLIPNGVDRALFYPPAAGERELARQQSGFASETPLLLFVGRFTFKKGLHFIQKLAEARPQWNFLLIGTGEVSPSSWGLLNVHVLPPQPQSSLRSFYLIADLLLLPSVGEGVPLVVQEAMACGLPVALSAETSSSLPNAPLIILDAVEKVDKSLQILDTYLNDKLKMDTLRILAAEYANQWDWNKVANEYETLFAAYL